MGIRWKTISATAMIALACLLPGCALQQVMIGQWYTISTPQADACPRLVWQFVVDAQRSIEGSVSRHGQQPIASLSGVLNTDDSFQITATEASGSRTASVTGQFTSQVSTISIHGPGVGGACDGQVFKLQLRRYFTSQGGGGGGGG